MKIEISNNSFNVNEIQIKVIEKLNKIFKNKYTKDLDIIYQPYIGLFGNFIGKEKLLIVIKFNYLDFVFEIYIHYDQLEYYISKNNLLKFKCNIESDDYKLLLIDFFSKFKYDLLTIVELHRNVEKL